MSTSFSQRCRQLLSTLGISQGDDQMVITPLTGGVSSDIGLVELGLRCLEIPVDEVEIDELQHRLDELSR